MKRVILILFILVLVLISCMPSTPPNDSTSNNPPTKPSNPTPNDGATEVSLTPTLLWEASDPDGDALKFDVYFGVDTNPSLEVSDLSTNTYNPGTLNSKTTYYWKIVAKDGKGGETEGPLWSFTTGVIVLQRTLGGSGVDVVNGIQQTDDGGYIVAGYTGSDDVSGYNGWTDCWIVKLDAKGNIEWEKALGGSDYDEAYSIQQTDDGGYIVAGYTKSNDGDVKSGNHGLSDYWIVKLDAKGNIEWEKALGGSDYDEAYSIQQTNDGGYVVAGGTWSNDGDVKSGNHGLWDYWIVKLDANGNIEWEKTLGGSWLDKAYSIQQTDDGGYIVAGYTESNDGDLNENHGEEDYWVVKLNANGNIEWEKTFGGSYDEWARSIQQTNEGGYVVAGSTWSNDGDVSGNHSGTDFLTSDFWIVKLDSLGGMEWEKALGGSWLDKAYSIKQTSDGGYIVVGETESNDGDVKSGNHGEIDCWVVKLDANGNIKWEKTLGGSEWDVAYSVQQSKDGDYIIAGYTDSNDGNVISENHGEWDGWIVKLGK